MGVPLDLWTLVVMAIIGLFMLAGFIRGCFDDPVKSCEVYRKEGCSHVDGIICDMKTCSTLEQYKNEESHCPVCGYYCLGKGGIGCIDKPKLCGYNTQTKQLDNSTHL